MLNDKDSHIVRELKDNGRKSIREIAKTTKIRPSTVHQRIQRLLKEKVIEKFTIQTNDDKVGESFIAFLLIKGTTQQYLSSSFVHDTRVKEVFGVTGEYDVLVKMKFSDVKEFNDFIISFRKKNPGIQTTLTMVGTAKIKEEF